MATSNPTPPPHHSPHPSVTAAANVAPNMNSSPRSRRYSAPLGGASSPWSQIVRGTELESIPSSSLSPTTSAAATSAATVAPTAVVSPSSAPLLSDEIQEHIVEASSDWSEVKSVHEAGEGASFSSASVEEAVITDPQWESSDNGGSSNTGKKPVWNRPSPFNGAAEVSPVMGAVLWPALSESTKASPKSSSSDSLKNLSEGSPSIPQGTGISTPSSPRQGISNNANPSSNPNHAAPTRQRSMKRGNGGGTGNSSNSSSANGGFSQAPPPQGLVVEPPSNNSGKSANSSAESSAKESTLREGGGQRGLGSQSHSGSEHQQQRHSYRRSNSGPHPRGDGSHHHNHGGRRDPDRGNQDWNSHRHFGGRDGHMQSQRGSSRPFMRGPPHANTPYIPPPPIPVRPPFGTPMVYPGPEVPSPVIYLPGPPADPFRPLPMVAPFQPVYIPFGDPHLPMRIVNQIDYYFSNENLVRDTYLRRNMDEQGWVSVKLIAGFKKVSQLTDNIQLILAALQSSNVVEVEGDKVRRRDDWTKWIIPSVVQYSTVSSPQSIQKSNLDTLAESLEGTTMDEKSIRNVEFEKHPSRSSSGEFSSR